MSDSEDDTFSEDETISMQTIHNTNPPYTVEFYDRVVEKLDYLVERVEENLGWNNRKDSWVAKKEYLEESIQQACEIYEVLCDIKDDFDERGETVHDWDDVESLMNKVGDTE